MAGPSVLPSALAAEKADLEVSTGTRTSDTIPQAATSLLEVCVQAVLKADLGRPIDAWLKAQAGLIASAQRQAASILSFLDLLGDSRQLPPETRDWRSDCKSLTQALILRFRRGYGSAGCGAKQCDLIGNPLLSKEALARVLEKEPPFQRLEHPDTRRNAIRFACHVHEAISAGKLVPQQEAEGVNASPEQHAREVAHARFGPSRPALPPTFRDQGTIVNPKRYRIARLQDDLWVYGTVQFESPKGAGDFAWLSTLDADEQARWLEQLAAALLQEADALRQAKPC